ncbi:MAG: ATP-binding protein, partial [Chloroflexota bacterium]|nr:ATP-binding protein [Chloroflexota bacterium]
KGIIGQPRAARAIEFGISIPSHGFNIYALGPTGSGKTFAVKKFLEEKAAKEEVPDDWCYVNNFSDPRKPRAIRLPAGKGVEFQRDMDELVDHLRSEIPRAFESEEYEKEKERISSQFQKMRDGVLSKLKKRVKKKGFALARTPAGLVVAPTVEGEMMSQEQYRELSDEKRKELDKARNRLQKALETTLSRIGREKKEVEQKINELDKGIAGSIVPPYIEELKGKYGSIAEVADYLEEVRKDVVENVGDFKSSGGELQVKMMGLEIPLQPMPFTKYKVNVIVDNSQAKGAPVVVESNPTYRNLIGRIEHRPQLGALFTNFTMIKAGALHSANGGYLVVEAEDVLTRPFAWEALKRAIENREIKTEELGERYQVISTVTLEPEPIPLDVKMVLVGNPRLYYLLYELDEDFQKFFKVKADFAVQMDRTPENMSQYALFIRDRCEEEGLKHFDRSGVARVIEYSSRLMEDQEKLSTRFGLICDLIREASYWSGKNGHEFVTADNVQQAIEEKFYRSNLVEERIRELIEDGTIFIDADGEVEGQVNGISIVTLGDYTFGKPSRITARTFMGKSGVVDIEREVEMSGRIHNKGVMALAAYLGGKYAQDVPLALSASLSFEQLYEEVEGDSAASTELYALLSSLSGYPLKQGIAVTGSVNQRGEVQPVGGVTRKIEGFFDVCKVKGLTGEQGVIIP